MNTGGLLAKYNFNGLQLLNPTYLYKTPSNSYMSVIDLYISVLPNISANFNIYISKMNIIPNVTDQIMTTDSTILTNGTIVINGLQLEGNETIFASSQNLLAQGNVTIQVRGRTEIILPEGITDG